VRAYSSSGTTGSSDVTAAAGRSRAAWIVLGLLTAVQVGIGTWRAAVMFQQGLAAGVRPVGPSAGLGADLLLCGLLALAAWWWLPARGHRSAAAWALRFLTLTWVVALVDYGWALATGRLAPAVTWVALGVAFIAGVWVRRTGPSPSEDRTTATEPAVSRSVHPALWLALAFFLAEVPHLVFPYHYTDAVEIWACRAFKFAERGALSGIFDCLDPPPPPLHSVILWMGVGDPTFQGRLLPLLLFGAFVLLFYYLLRRVAPALAPWGLVWLLVTDHVLKGQITAYAGVPVMLAIAVAIVVATDDGALIPTRALALTIGAVAGAAVALIRRDGLPEFVVAMGVLIWLASPPQRRDWRLWAPLAGAAVGYLSWTLRPAAVHAPALFAPTLAAQSEAAVSALRAMARLAYGVQGQVFSHYGYGAFAWSWLIVVIWVARRGGGGGVGGEGEATRAALARRFGLAGLAGWVATYAAYAALTFLGQPHMSTLFIIHTGFGRHLVHFYPFCLLHAVASAERLLERTAV
jgi:hypothetical protein